MSIMYITEYSRVGDTNGGYVSQVGHHSGNNPEQQITFTTASSSAAFAENTKFIRVVCDGAAFLSFGENPTAITSQGIPVQANSPEYFGVVGGHKISAVT